MFKELVDATFQIYSSHGNSTILRLYLCYLLCQNQMVTSGWMLLQKASKYIIVHGAHYIPCLPKSNHNFVCYLIICLWQRRLLVFQRGEAYFFINSTVRCGDGEKSKDSMQSWWALFYW